MHLCYTLKIAWFYSSVPVGHDGEPARQEAENEEHHFIIFVFSYSDMLKCLSCKNIVLVVAVISETSQKLCR